MQRTTTVLLGAAAVALGACASTGSSVYGPGDVDREPELYGCPNVEMGAGPTLDVDVVMVIGTDGRVESARARPGPRTSNRRTHVPDSLIAEAERIARQCSFMPAERAGVPVRYRMTKTFEFSYQPDQL